MYSSQLFILFILCYLSFLFTFTFPFPFSFLLIFLFTSLLLTSNSVLHPFYPFFFFLFPSPSLRLDIIHPSLPSLASHPFACVFPPIFFLVLFSVPSSCLHLNHPYQSFILTILCDLYPLFLPSHLPFPRPLRLHSLVLLVQRIVMVDPCCVPRHNSAREAPSPWLLRVRIFAVTSCSQAHASIGRVSRLVDGW